VNYHLGTSVSEVVEAVELASKEAVSADSGRLLGPERKSARIGALVGVVFFVLLATLGQPWNMFHPGAYSSDFYDYQAQSMVRGHLDIPEAVAGLEGIPVDGKTQIYYGVGPAILRMPLSGWIGGLTGRLGILSMTIAVGVLGLAAARLLGRSRKLVDPDAVLAPFWFGVMAAAATICTPALFVAARSNVYHEAAIWGCAASLAGLDLVLRWWREPTRRTFVAAVSVGAFAVSCRVTSGIAPAIAIGLFGIVLAFRRQWSRALIAVLGAVVALLGFVAFNWLRFGSLFSQRGYAQIYSQFNETRKQFLEANDGRVVGPQFLPTTVTRYFSPFAMGWQRLFPFVKFGPLQQPVGNVVFDGVSGQSSSITLGAPVFLGFAAIGAWWTALRDKTREWLVISVAALLAALGTLAFGSIQHRYLVDMVPAVIVLACSGIWLVRRRFATFTTTIRRLLKAVALVVSLLALWLQLGLVVETRAFIMNPTESETKAFASLQNAIDQRLFGDSPPNLLQLSGEDLPRTGNVDGTLMILDDCAGLYRYNSLTEWIVVERKPGGGRRFVLTGVVDDRPEPLLQGFGWSLTAQRTPEGVVFVYDATNGRHEESTPTQLPDGPLTFDVVADQAQPSTISVRHGDEVLLKAYYVGVQYPTPSPEWTSASGSAPLCESLLALRENELERTRH